jgi:RHS repeat-associated protein
MLISESWAAQCAALITSAQRQPSGRESGLQPGHSERASNGDFRVTSVPPVSCAFSVPSPQDPALDRRWLTETSLVRLRWFGIPFCLAPIPLFPAASPVLLGAIAIGLGLGNTTVAWMLHRPNAVGRLLLVRGLATVLEWVAGLGIVLVCEPPGPGGDNTYGELGNGSKRQSNTPVQVVGPSGSGYLTGIVAIAAGYRHAIALKNDGTVWAWGADNYGQLGNGATQTSTTPVQASNLSGINGSVTTTYQYDGNGLRMHRTTGLTTSNVAWDYSQGVPLLLTDGSTLYVYGLDGLPIEQVDSQGNVLSLHADQLGSTRALTDPTRAVVGTFTYDAYGKLTAQTGTASTALRFAGQYFDAESGLYYLRARSYDPGTGQFLSRDPIAFITRAPYGYAVGNPLNLADPTGLYDYQVQRYIGEAARIGSPEQYAGG